MVLRLQSILVMLVPMLAGAGPLELHVNVIHDRILEQHREITLTFEAAGRCVFARDVVVDLPYTQVARTSCLVELVGPADRMPSVRVAGKGVAVPAARRASTPDPPPKPTGSGVALDLVAARPNVPIGHDVVAAFLRVSVDGKPASDVELTVTARGAHPRKLHWLATGLAEVEVFAPAWQASIEVAAQHAGEPATRLELPIDRGAPATVSIAMPSVRVGVPFTPSVRVLTSDGVELASSEVRLELPDCEAENGGFRCMRAGSSELQVALVEDGVWVPVERTSIEVAAALPRDADRRLGWLLAARTGRSSDQTWWGGLVAAGTSRVTASTRVLVALSWQFQQPTFAGRAPVVGNLELAQHEFELRAGGEVALEAGVPWVLHLAVGPAIVRQRARLDTITTSSTGFEVAGVAGGGVRLRLGSLALAIGLDVHLTRALVSPTWAVPAGEVLLEVGVASR